MWKTLHQLAIPPRLYQICGWFIPWLAIASVVVLTVGWIWGFGFAPADYQQGNSYRIIYLHVPAAIWSMGIYASMAVAAFIGLVWQMKMANLAVAAMAPIGAVFTFIALVTGSAWGKPMWGTWWVWDARLTSELVLLFFVCGCDCPVARLRRPPSGGPCGRYPGADWRGESADYSLLRGVVEHPASGINADAAKYRSGDAFAAALVDFWLPAPVCHADADADA